jgi:glyoxylase-like metal-dependent hydrolase (beta-lactamase superfamily II)
MAAARKPSRDETLVKALVRAHRWRRRIESGQAKSITDLAEQEGVTVAYLPEGWDAARYRVPPAPAGRELEEGDIVDLGDRIFEVVHTPGHSPGGIGLFERASRIFLSGDIIYDGPLIDDAYHSERNNYLATMNKLRTLPVSVVHGGHFPSFGATRFRQIIDEYCAGRRKPGCHLA